MKPIAILTADWHIRESVPTCRTDNFYKTQKKKLSFIAELANKYEIPIILAGDLFHKWKTSPRIESLIIEQLKKTKQYLIAIPGNHDLPAHNVKEIKRSSYNVIYQTGLIRKDHENFQAYTFPYGKEIENNKRKNTKLKICIAHQLTYDIKKPWADCQADSATKLLKKYNGYDLILTGDNHQSFTRKYEGKLLVNPGSITRQTAGQIDFKPSVYIWYSDNTVKRVFLPIEKDVINREHLKKAEERSKKLETFIETLKNNKDIDLNFEKNMEKHININPDIHDRVIKKIWEHI
jgi:DNA repair exonuclease SbcCD nuclease subunit